MPTEIPSLWPAEAIRVDVLSPHVILRRQATELGRLSQGLLRGEVSRAEGKDSVVWQFDAVAPAAGNLRRRVATVTHPTNEVYPAIIEELGYDEEDGVPWGRAHSQQMFIEKLGERLQSGDVVAMLQSLIARSNESQRVAESERGVSESDGGQAPGERGPEESRQDSN